MLTQNYAEPNFQDHVSYSYCGYYHHGDKQVISKHNQDNLTLQSKQLAGYHFHCIDSADHKNKCNAVKEYLSKDELLSSRISLVTVMFTFHFI